MSAKPRVGLDVDGVLADFSGYCLRAVNDRLGASLTTADWTSWWPRDCFGQLGAAVEAVVDELIADESGACLVDCDPLPGAIECVAELAERFEVHAITSIPARLLDRRVEWLFRHGFRVWECHVAHDKPPLVASLGLLAFADDKHTTANAVSERTTARSFLIDTHANQGVPLLRKVRRASLRQATDLLLGRRPA